MDDRKKLKEAIKTIIRKSLVSGKKGKGVMDYYVEPASRDLSYTEGGFLESLDRLKPFFDIFTKYIVPNYDKPRKGKGLEYDIPPFDDDYEGGLVAEGMRKRKGKALVANGLIAEGLIAEGMRKRKGKALVANGLVAEGLIAEGMKKRKGRALIGLAQQPAELPYTELYGQGFNYDKHGERKKGAPRGDKGKSLKKFNDIVRQLRAKDSSMTLAEARTKAKSIYRS